VLLALLAVTAGCLGGIGPGDSGDGPTTRGTPTEGTGTDGIDGDGTTAGKTDDGTATTGDGTTAGDGDDDAPAVVAPPFDPAALRSAHLSALRGAGSVTVRGNQEIRRVDGPGSVESSTVARVDMDSGAALVRRNRSGRETATYVAPNGTAYGRQVTATGETRILTPRLARDPNTSRIVAPSILGVANATDLTYAGRTSRGGVEGYVYEAEGPETAGAALLESLNASREELNGYRLVVVLSPDGVVTYGELFLNVTTDDGTLVLRDRERFAALGETAVTEPDWVAEARRKAARPGPNDVVTERFAVDAPGGLVEEYVTAKKHSLDPGRALGPVVNENPVYRNDFLNRSRVGGLVRVYWLSAEDVRRVRVVFHYDESNVPDGNESALTVVWDDRSGPPLDPLDSTVDPENDTVTVTVTDPDRLERLQGQTMFVLQYEHYVETVRNQRIRPGIRAFGVR